MDNCIFCKIIKKEIPADIVYEDGHSMAFLDISPQMKGHTLVLPKHHCRNILDCPDAVLQSFSITLRDVSEAVKDAVKADGINIQLNNEHAAGQLVFHMHAHILPRYLNDAVSLTHNTKKVSLTKAEMHEIRDSISSNL